MNTTTLHTLLRTAIVHLLFAAGAGAQVVRGTVTESSTGLPLRGVLVSLVATADTRRASASEALSALTDARGAYTIRAPSAGTFRVLAKRIGVQRRASEAFALAPGETRRVDLTLEPVAHRLPEVLVTAGLCTVQEAQRPRVAALWDEARTALTANQVSLRDRLFEGHVTRYARELDPRSLRVLSESRSDVQGILDRPLTGLDGDSLSAVGFWHPMTGGGIAFHAPDAHVLLSAAFQRDHCFSVVDGGRSRRGMVGLAFEPAPARTVGEVSGAVWLDARTFELRLVEFGYRGITVAGAERAGGELHYVRLESGAWAMNRWFVRIPQERALRLVPRGGGGCRAIGRRPTGRDASPRGGGGTQDRRGSTGGPVTPTFSTAPREAREVA